VAAPSRDPDLEDCAIRITTELARRCPVGRYRPGTPGNMLIISAVYEMLEADIIEIGPQLNRTVKLSEREALFRG
jgi:hypothetical protein